jgi:hypothetical protein
MFKVLHEKRLAGWVMLLGTVALTGCGGGGFDARSTLESRPARLDGEQILLDQTQLDCGVREDLWIVSPLGDARSVARLTQKARDLQFSDDVQIGDPEIKLPYAQIRGSFPITVLQMSSVRDQDAFTKLAEAKVGVRIDHSCFQNPLPVLMGVRHGKFDPSSNPVFRLKLEGDAWLTDQVVH